MSDHRLVVGVTGASGAPYALRLLGHLARLGHGVDLLVSRAAGLVLRQEVDPSKEWVKDGLAVLEDFGLNEETTRTFGSGDYMAPVASGTALRRGMVIVPCSMGTAARIASGVSTSLIDRAADVCLKERRPLVLCVRETPLSLIHLRNMERLTESGAIVLPAAPGFYNRPQSIEDLLDHVCAKILDSLSIEHDVIRRWGGDS